MAPGATAALGLLLLLAIFSAAATAAPIVGLDTFLTNQYRHDPQATNDSYLSLPSSLRSSLSFEPLAGRPPRHHVTGLIDSLSSLSLSVPVHVRLVGSSFPPDSSSLLSSFLSASLPSGHFHVIAPFASGGRPSHRLSLRHSLHLDVSHAPPSLSSSLSDALRAEIARSPSSLRNPLLSVPYATVDGLIRQDFEREKPVEGVYVYFLDLGQQEKQYAYGYTPGDSSPGFTKCLGSIWTGRERYVWIDLAAGPVDYGPALSGDGVLPRGEFHPLAALHGRPKSHKALLADLASLVWSAYQDMVIAARTKVTQTVSDYNCNGRHVFTQTRDLERPLVGSILQSMWGVAPTHLSWSSRHNNTLVDYTWSVGQTPFGPFSEISSLSFVQKDAARRNVLLTSLNYSITSAIDVLESIMSHGGDRSLLKLNQHAEFIQRWNLFKYKLDKAVSALSHFDFEMALYYLRSSDHDLYGIHSLVYQASQELEASLVCFKDPPLPWGSISISVVGVLAFFYFWTKRDRIFRNKRKQF
ncbi:hypothetical protein BT93_J1484 [Corymbia citriodora subsp. variegata]|nr:hypothetical protein BT93_J1484 [Corymbia citriodora subsp. variegata]